MKQTLYAKTATMVRVLIASLFLLSEAFAQAPSYIYDGTNQGYIGALGSYLAEDKGLSPKEALNAKFTPFNNEVQAIPQNKNNIWVRFDVCNRSGEDIGVKVDLSYYDFIDFYLIDNGTFIDSLFLGEKRISENDILYNKNNVFQLSKLKQGYTNTVLIRLNNIEQIVLPIKVGRLDELERGNDNRRFVFGIYTGIMLVMFLYNIFLAFSVRERIYLYYLLHLLFAWLTQACFQGIAAHYFWPENAYLIDIGFTASTCMVSIMGIMFMRGFLQTHLKLTWQDSILKGFLIFYIVALAATILGMARIAFAVVLPVQALISIYILYVSVLLIIKGSRQARFYLIGWTALFAGITIYVLKDFGILPYNIFTNFSLQAGTALEVVLLSIALADRINILEFEKKELVRKQKDELQREVYLRTAELRNSNQSLEKAYNDLKAAQTQLINAEKMASLGQLTAGIAHEINNPINFINANVKPLNRDFNDLIEIIDEYKQVTPDNCAEQLPAVHKKERDLDIEYTKKEIVELLAGMAEGAQRTTEIVRGLRIFSRLDEADFNKTNIIEGIESTLILLNSAMQGDIDVEREYAEIPMIDCYPGKLNQVFMNIISNAIYAIHRRPDKNVRGSLRISAKDQGDKIVISFKDNGCGMNESTLRNIFEPFYTTKPVGEGTGMGMTISYGIIVNDHKGNLYATSVPGKGTNMIIEIPRNLSEIKNK